MPSSTVLSCAPDAADIVALLAGTHGDPFALLGLHPVRPKGPLCLRALMPGAVAMRLLAADGTTLVAPLELVDAGGVFAALVPQWTTPQPYRLWALFDDGNSFVFDDAYRFPPLLGELDLHLLAEGRHERLYEVLGAQVRTLDGVTGVAFAVWAPNAQRASVIGNFCAWDPRRLPMRKRHECGVWEIFVPGVAAGAPYKFALTGTHGEVLPWKADPLARWAECPPHTASRVAGPLNHVWNDAAWMTARAAATSHTAPMAVYEVHLPSWRRVPEEGGRYLSYRELADTLVPYAVEMGFTHLELLPVTEYPFDGSWGYQPIGLYAPTARHGGPEDFAAFVDACHQAGLGVILDWVPGHFPADAHGLARFDGSHLYEHADPRQGFQPDWNTLIYNFGRREVANFLLGSALCWLEHYHLDGLRVDAVASMLYLDYSRPEGAWIPNRYGGRENLEAIAFLQELNRTVYGRHPGCMTIAEESTAWPGVSRPAHLGGLGFGYKWNMGWMHDTLRYMSKDPIHRRWHHNDMTFGLLYAFSENFILPLSHDEVVHGKGSLLNKMSGDRWQKFANLRAYFGFLYGHPGRKLLFMGGEFGQEREWNYDSSLDWHVLADQLHSGLQRLVRDLNHIYRSLPPLHVQDNQPDSFAWIEANDSDNSVFSFLRYGPDRTVPLVIVCHFTPVPRQGYRLGVPLPGRYIERVNTDSALYGGSNMGNSGDLVAEEIPCHGHPWSLCLTVPPLATLLLERAE